MNSSVLFLSKILRHKDVYRPLCVTNLCFYWKRKRVSAFLLTTLFCTLSSYAIAIPIPQLTLYGMTHCEDGMYTIVFTTSATDVSASIGTLDMENGKIINIPIGENVTLTAGTGDNTVSATAISPAMCPPATCNLPELAVHNPICEGVEATSYHLTFSSNTNVISTSAGIISGTSIYNIPLGENVIITAGTGACSVSVMAYSPKSCVSPCSSGQFLSMSNPLCGNGFYDLYFVRFSGVQLIVVPKAGNIDTNSITSIPLGTNLKISAFLTDCPTPQLIYITAPSCPMNCKPPQLSISGAISCELETYNIHFIANGIVNSDFGVIGTNTITDIPLGQNIKVSAKDESCMTTAVAIAPVSCQNDCQLPYLMVGDPICDSINAPTYRVTFYTDNDTIPITSNLGTVLQNSVEGIPIGQSVTLTAGSGDCMVSLTRPSPESCVDPCTKKIASVVETVCSVDNKTYSIRMGAMSGVSISANFGIVNEYNIIDIPIEQSVMIKVKHPSCLKKHDLIVHPPLKCKSPFLDNHYTIEIPNAFSPNGDGKDDFFVIENLPENSSLFIYNNWGNLIYKSSNYINNWNGACSECNSKDKQLPTSTYYYVLDINLNNQQSRPTRYTGMLYLAR